MLVAVEWSNVFVLRPVAEADPAALDKLGESALMLGGFSSAIGLFGLGWLLLAISALRAGALDRWASMTVLAGLVLTTAVVLGLGLVGWGRSVSVARA